MESWKCRELLLEKEKKKRKEKKIKEKRYI
jgi:hypothetical protein